MEFIVEGNGEVHLTGYYDPSELSEGESEELSVEEESVEDVNLLKKAQ